MLPGTAICVCQYVTSFEANSKKFLINFFLALLWPSGQPETAEELQGNMFTKADPNFSFWTKSSKRSERLIYKDTSQDDLESAGKIEQYHQKTLLTEYYIKNIISEFYQQLPKMRISTKLDNGNLKLL